MACFWWFATVSWLLTSHARVSRATPPSASTDRLKATLPVSKLFHSLVKWGRKDQNRCSPFFSFFFEGKTSISFSTVMGFFCSSLKLDTKTPHVKSALGSNLCFSVANRLASCCCFYLNTAWRCFLYFALSLCSNKAASEVFWVHL